MNGATITKKPNWPASIRTGRQSLHWEKRPREIGYHPGKSQANSPEEWLAFIEGYAHQEHWLEAQDFTLSSFGVDTTYRTALCSLWEKINRTSPSQA